MKRPVSLVIVALLFILVGLNAVSHVFRWLFHFSAIDINVGVLGIFVGIGLLRLNRGWRTCALVVVWFSFALAAGWLGALILSLDSLARVTLRFDGEIIFKPTHPEIGWEIFVAFTVLVYWVYRVLTGHDVRRPFGLEEAQPNTGVNVG